MRKGVPTDIGGARAGRPVRHLVHEERQVRQLRHRRLGKAVQTHLQPQTGDDGEQIRVSRPLAVAVDGALDVDRARAHGGKGVGRAAVRVVVGMHPHRHAGKRRHDAGDDLGNLVGERAAVRVAGNERVRARLGGGPERGDRVLRVRLVAVEEVLGVVDDLAPVVLEEADGVADHGQVLVEGRLERLDHMEVPGLAEQRDDRGVRVEEMA